MKKTMLSLLCLLLCAALCACTVAPAVGTEPGTQPSVGSTGTSGSTGSAEPAPAAGYDLHAAGDYAEVLTLLSARREATKTAATGGIMLNGGTDMATADTAETAAVDAPAMAPEMPAPEPEDGGNGDAGDYSGTNVQVDGIDEGDIVKTDGRYLYVMDDAGGVRILEADGADTHVVGMIEGEGDGWGSELYVEGDVLAIVRSSYGYKSESKDGTRTIADLYDIADRTAPIRTSSLAQDGYYSTSRLLDGTLYLISSLYVWNWGGAEPAEDTYIPCVYTDGAETLLPAGCILLPEQVEDESYTVVTAMTLATGERLSEQAVLGCAGTVYMSTENLYLCTSRYDESAGDERTEDQYTVVDYRSAASTLITRFSLADGALTLGASGSIPGTLLNQFSLDERDGFLRVVTSVDEYTWSIYTDAKYDFTNYRDGESLRCNALYVLDGALQTVGSVTDLAPDERVYSVRFAGDIGYFVTYKQVDPLFAVDLSDPTNPTVLSALKIPGFSQYLHVYGDGLLFGLGQNTTGDEGQFTDGLKLSMFDTSDPADVSELTTLALDGDWSEAQYNHKAILVLPAKDVIAFPMDGKYVVYGYGADGFYQRAEMELGELWMDAARGVQIGETFYVCARNGVGVYSLTDFTRLAELAF